MSTPKLVEAFYRRIWNDGDLDAVTHLLTHNFLFRGSLGNETRGREAFKAYVRSVRESLAEYRCEILSCVGEGDQAFTKMHFSGRHIAPFRGYKPTGSLVEWFGAALFKFENSAIGELWVLGDLAGLDSLLKTQAADSGGRLPKRSASKTSNGLDLPEIVRVLQATPAVLESLIAGLPDRVIAWHPGAEKWCIKEVVGHLTEEDRADFVGGIQAMLDQQEPHLTVNDQDEVARLRHDCAKGLRDLVDEFSKVRFSSVGLVAKLEQPQLDRGGAHPRIGHIRVGELLYEWIYHDLHHMRQIGANIQGFLWNQLGSMKQFYEV